MHEFAMKIGALFDFDLSKLKSQVQAFNKKIQGTPHGSVNLDAEMDDVGDFVKQLAKFLEDAGKNTEGVPVSVVPDETGLKDFGDRVRAKLDEVGGLFRKLDTEGIDLINFTPTKDNIQDAAAYLAKMTEVMGVLRELAVLKNEKRPPGAADYRKILGEHFEGQVPAWLESPSKIRDELAGTINKTLTELAKLTRELEGVSVKKGQLVQGIKKFVMQSDIPDVLRKLSDAFGAINEVRGLAGESLLDASPLQLPLAAENVHAQIRDSHDLMQQLVGLLDGVKGGTDNIRQEQLQEILDTIDRMSARVSVLEDFGASTDGFTETANRVGESMERIESAIGRIEPAVAAGVEKINSLEEAFRSLREAMFPDDSESEKIFENFTTAIAGMDRHLQDIWNRADKIKQYGVSDLLARQGHFDQSARVNVINDYVQAAIFEKDPMALHAAIAKLRDYVHEFGALGDVLGTLEAIDISAIFGEKAAAVGKLNALAATNFDIVSKVFGTIKKARESLVIDAEMATGVDPSDETFEAMQQIAEKAGAMIPQLDAMGEALRAAFDLGDYDSIQEAMRNLIDFEKKTNVFAKTGPGTGLFESIDLSHYKPSAEKAGESADRMIEIANQKSQVIGQVQDVYDTLVDYIRQRMETIEEFQSQAEPSSSLAFLAKDAEAALPMLNELAGVFQEALGSKKVQDIERVGDAIGNLSTEVLGLKKLKNTLGEAMQAIDLGPLRAVEIELEPRTDAFKRALDEIKKTIREIGGMPGPNIQSMTEEIRKAARDAGIDSTTPDATLQDGLTLDSLERKRDGYIAVSKALQDLRANYADIIEAHGDFRSSVDETQKQVESLIAHKEGAIVDIRKRFELEGIDENEIRRVLENASNKVQETLDGKPPVKIAAKTTFDEEETKRETEAAIAKAGKVAGDNPVPVPMRKEPAEDIKTKPGVVYDNIYQQHSKLLDEFRKLAKQKNEVVERLEKLQAQASKTEPNTVKRFQALKEQRDVIGEIIKLLTSMSQKKEAMAKLDLGRPSHDIESTHEYFDRLASIKQEMRDISELMELPVDKTQVAAGLADALTGETVALETNTAAWDKHAEAVKRAIEAEREKAAVASKVAEALADESRAADNASTATGAGRNETQPDEPSKTAEGIGNIGREADNANEHLDNLKNTVRTLSDMGFDLGEFSFDMDPAEAEKAMRGILEKLKLSFPEESRLLSFTANLDDKDKMTKAVLKYADKWGNIFSEAFGIKVGKKGAKTFERTGRTLTASNNMFESEKRDAMQKLAKEKLETQRAKLQGFSREMAESLAGEFAKIRNLADGIVDSGSLKAFNDELNVLATSVRKLEAKSQGALKVETGRGEAIAEVEKLIANYTLLFKMLGSDIDNDSDGIGRTMRELREQAEVIGDTKGLKRFGSKLKITEKHLKALKSTMDGMNRMDPISAALKSIEGGKFDAKIVQLGEKLEELKRASVQELAMSDVDSTGRGLPKILAELEASINKVQEGMSVLGEVDSGLSSQGTIDVYNALTQSMQQAVSQMSQLTTKTSARKKQVAEYTKAIKDLAYVQDQLADADISGEDRIRYEEQAARLTGLIGDYEKLNYTKQQQLEITKALNAVNKRQQVAVADSPKEPALLSQENIQKKRTAIEALRDTLGEIDFGTAPDGIVAPMEEARTAIENVTAAWQALSDNKAGGAQAGLVEEYTDKLKTAKATIKKVSEAAAESRKFEGLNEQLEQTGKELERIRELWGSFDAAPNVGRQLESLEQSARDIGEALTEALESPDYTKFASLKKDLAELGRNVKSFPTLGLVDDIQKKRNALERLQTQFNRLSAGIPEGQMSQSMQHVANAVKAAETALENLGNNGDLQRQGELGKEFAAKLGLANDAMKSLGVDDRQVRNFDKLVQGVQQKQQELATLGIKWSELKADPQLEASWQSLRKETDELVTSMLAAREAGDTVQYEKLGRQFAELTQRVKTFRAEVQGAGRAKLSFGDAVMATGRKLSAYLISMLGFGQMIRHFREGMRYVLEIDRAMTALRRVTDETAETYNRFLTDAYDRARRLNVSVNQIVNATAD